MTQVNEELSGYLRELVGKSQAQQIPWQKVNPTTFAANIANASARMTIQRIDRPPQVATVARRLVGGVVRTVPVAPVTAGTSYVFQLLEAPTGASVITLNSAKESEVSAILEELYRAIEGIGEKKALDLLKKIVSG